MPTKEQTRLDIIRGYRQLLGQRYQYAAIASQYDIPESFSQEKVEAFRDFFLEYIYPGQEQRQTLDEAFRHLDNYIQQPRKLLQILLESGRMIFKHGRHLPGILSAGLRALRSFRAATHFEERIVEAAVASATLPPYGETEINSFIRSLPPKEIDDFIASNEVLFRTLHDRKLVENIQEIVSHLIQRMKARPQLFSPSEVQAMEMGREIIHKGKHLFDTLSQKEQELIFTFIIQMERDNLARIFQ